MGRSNARQQSRSGRALAARSMTRHETRALIAAFAVVVVRVAPGQTTSTPWDDRLGDEYARQPPSCFSLGSEPDLDTELKSDLHSEREGRRVARGSICSTK